LNFEWGELSCSMRPFLFAFILLPAQLLAQNITRTFDFNRNCQLAYKEIIQLKLTAGQAVLDAEKKIHPGNLIPFLLENYIDFFVLYFNEDPGLYALRKGNLEKRLRMMNTGPQSSPFYLFSKAILHFQWAAVKIKFGNNWDAGWEFRRSFLQVKENGQLFSVFKPNAMLSGAMQVAAGTIPDGYHWLSSLLGIRGTIKEGMQELEQFISLDDPMSLLFHDEAVFYYLYLQFYIQNKKAEVFEFIRQNKTDIKNNHLFTFLAANLALNAQQSALAEKIIGSKNDDAAYLDMPVWDFLVGSARLNHLETDANQYLERYLTAFKGKFYLKDVLQKISWHYYLSGDQANANKYRRLVLEKGNTETEADKQALNEAGNDKWPDKTLLKARLLDDGGYYAEALAVLQGMGSKDFNSDEDKLEFAYRRARIYDDQGREEEAITAYELAIKMGLESKSYFAARAALQIGFIYEKRKDFPRALIYYQQCLDSKEHDYKNSLDQKAKAGIERCKQE